MASDPRDLHHPLRSCDAASPADHPAAAGDRKVKLLCSFGGQILPRLTDGALRYAGGETRIITVRRDSPLPEILRRMAEAYGGPVALRYQLPDEDLDALISVSTTEDLEHMMDECDKLAAQGSSVKLRVFLLSPSEGSGSGADPLSSFHDLQDTGARYIEAVNGLDSSIRRKDSVASFTSTQNSDVNEGMLTGHPSPTATSAQDASKLLFAAQDVQDLPSATSYDDQTQFLISTQLEPQPLVPNQDTILKLTQAELPSVVQPLTDLHHGQTMNSQSYTVTGLPSEVSFVSAAQPAYLSPSHDGGPAALDGNGASVPAVMDMHLKNPNGGKIAKFPGDAKLQPLSQLPPLPPPHLLAPTVDRHGLRQFPPLAQRHGLEDCSLCQRALPHVHSDSLIKEQGSGLRDAIPGANAVLQSHLSEDFTRTRAPQTVDTRTPVDKWVESQAQNLLASDPLVTYECSETIPEMSLGTERSVVQDAAYPVRTKVLVSPYSLGWPDISQEIYGTITDPQKSILEDSMLKPGEVPLTWNPNAENLDHSNILLTPASLALPSNPYGTSTIFPQSQSQDTLHQQVQSAQLIGYSKFLGNQVPISKPYVADGSSVENSEFQDGQSIRGTGPAFSCGYIRPMDEIMGALCTNPPGAHGFSNWPRHVGASKDLKPDQQPLVKVNTHNTGPEDKGNELSLSNPLLTEQPTALGEVSYLQSVQPANSSHIPSVAGSHGSQSCHLEAGVEPKRISNHEDLVYNDSTFNNEASNFLPVELLSDLNISKTIRTFEVGSSASALESSEIPVPNLISHETNETKPQSNKDISSIKISVEIDDDQTETIKTKQSEKVKNNGFPNTDDIGHLQVIKNSDLEELQELGSGAFGTVYYGKWRGTDVAIKRINDRVFSEKPSEQERARADFWNEACKLASLHHPNVVAFYGIVLDGPAGSIATLTEFMVNGSLRRVLQKNEKILDKCLCLLIAMDVAFGMEYLHSRNIIHFDLKSDNLLVNWRDPQRPICKVGDLGLAKVKYETLMSGGMRGTLPWMAPELLSGKENKYTEKVDVFSFGIVMWELTTGKEPYGDMHYGAIIGGILSNTLRPPVPESCDDEWRSLMEQCWATEPSQRPSFTEIASRLRAMAASLPLKS